jgi:hypothetical protein
MSTLNVTSIQNPAAPQANLSLNADGTVTLPVYTAGVAPALFQAGTLWYNTTASALQIRNAANTTWVATASGGGGGTVTGVTATAPLVSSGGAAPNLTINAATTSLPGSVQLADATASKVGTSATLVNTPAFSVPKDASGMTGAAILPGGADGTRPAAPTAGMTRWNSTRDYLEVYTGATAGWNQLEYVPVPDAIPPDLIISANTSLDDGTYFVKNFTVNAGVTLTTNGQAIVIICTGTATINGTVDLDGKGGAGAGSIAGAQGGASTGGTGIGVGAGQPNFGGSSYSSAVSIVGSGGAGSSAVLDATSAVVTGAGGYGGGGFVVRAAGNVTLSATGIINAKGTNGSPGNSGAGPVWSVSGAGGGSGGVVILRSDQNVSNLGTINVSGGAGSQAFSSTGSEISGGGGGGGGIVILQANGTVTNTGTVTLTGGVAGVPVIGFAGNGAGGGGGCGGAGGNGTSLAVPPRPAGPTAGGTGVLLFNGSPI